MKDQATQNTNLLDIKGNIFNIFDIFINTILKVWNYTIYSTTDKQPITLSNIIIGLILFIMGLKVARYLSLLTRTKILNALKLEHNVRDLLENIIHYLLIIFITFVILDISHVPLTVFAFIGSTLAISIGFGSQNILNNFISGLIIMVERPIRVGDYVEIDKTLGRVISVGARCVNIRTSDNIDILVPNGTILQNKVVNWTLNDDKVKVSIEVPIDYDMPTKKVEELILATINSYKEVLKDPLPSVYFKSFEENFLKFKISFWISINDADKTKVVSDLNHMIKAAISENF